LIKKNIRNRGMSEEGVKVINGTEDKPRSRSTSPNGDGKTVDKPKRFLNGWSKEQERLMAEWSDIAICYRWLHDKSDKIYHVKTLLISLPVIFLSTISGFSNIGVQAILESEEAKKYASFVIAGISLFAGLLTTIGDRLRYAQLEESHRVSAIAWGKFQRLIAVELALNPIDRMDSLDFLKICRADLDRLIEQSPSIPSEAITIFEHKFGQIKDLKKPDICGALEHTTVYSNSETRLKQMAVEASLMLRRRKQTLNELLSPQIEQKISEQVETRLVEAIEERKTRLEEELETKRQEELKTKEELNKALEERKKKLEEELELEKKLITPSKIKVSIVSTTSPKSAGSRYENRLNQKQHSAILNKADMTKQLHKSRLPSIAEPSIYRFEGAEQYKVAVSELPANTIIEPKPEETNDDSIVIVNKL
jgi:hypothetical protein